MTEQELVLVDKGVLPEVFGKVLEAKTLLSREIAKNSTDACRRVELSRSAFYKYKDKVFLYDDNDNGRLITYSLRLSDEPGVLSKVLIKLSSFGANVITVYQNIPVDRVAVVAISFKMNDEKADIGQLREQVAAIAGVIRVKTI